MPVALHTMLTLFAKDSTDATRYATDALGGLENGSLNLVSEN